MATTTTPTYTAGAAGNVRASAALAASGTDNQNVDYSAVLEAQIHVKNTPGTTAATRGLRIDVFRRYGTTPTTAETAFLTYTLPSATTGVVETLDFYVGTGKYNIKETNLDGTNPLTAVEVTADLISNLTTA